mmetsp:Transcript_9035/g.12500  ORF Transcript_9035/g.12500 Transcript_9035/m.12500 type:complete len:363 (+) Transcript_9035:472-1560(+)
MHADSAIIPNGGSKDGGTQVVLRQSFSHNIRKRCHELRGCGLLRILLLNWQSRKQSCTVVSGALEQRFAFSLLRNEHALNVRSSNGAVAVTTNCVVDGGLDEEASLLCDLLLQLELLRDFGCISIYAGCFRSGVLLCRAKVREGRHVVEIRLVVWVRRQLLEGPRPFHALAQVGHPTEEQLVIVRVLIRALCDAAEPPAVGLADEAGVLAAGRVETGQHGRLEHLRLEDDPRPSMRQPRDDVPRVFPAENVVQALGEAHGLRRGAPGEVGHSGSERHCERVILVRVLVWLAPLFAALFVLDITAAPFPVGRAVLRVLLAFVRAEFFERRLSEGGVGPGDLTWLGTSQWPYHRGRHKASSFVH